MPISQVVPSEAREILVAEQGAVYLDVRTEEEFAAGHPEGAFNVPLLQSDPAGGPPSFNEDFVATVEGAFPADTLVLCGCQAGGRSQRACEMLLSAGFSKVTNVQGGFGGARHPMTGEIMVAGWAEEGLPVSTEVPEECSCRGMRRRAGLEDEISSG